MKEITIPKKLEPIVKAFYAESEDMAKALLLQASRAIYNLDAEDDPFYLGSSKKITNDELDEVFMFMAGLKPRDMLEALFAAQIVTAHMFGMRRLASGGLEESRIGLKMLRFSNEALCQLQKKRAGCMQSITVNYNHTGSVPAPTATIIQSEVEDAD